MLLSLKHFNDKILEKVFIFYYILLFIILITENILCNYWIKPNL